MKVRYLWSGLFSAVVSIAAPAAQAADHVLIMTISDYPSQPLLGVRHDANNAVQLAGKLGYDTRAATVLKDRQLTGNGIRQAFAKLLSQVQKNDRVFVYYSGHGYSLPQAGTCVQGLVAQDETLIPTAELSQQLEGIKNNVSEALVIFDACHSGGNRDIAVTRSTERPKAATSDPERLHAKVWTPRGGERCEAAVNELAKTWRPTDEVSFTRGMAFPKNNFTFIAAANEREVALDDQEKGGLATVGLLQCANTGVTSSSGLVTANDLARCAQQYVANGVHEINARQSRKEYLPHQLEVYGNKEKVFDVRMLPAASVAANRADLVLAAFRTFAANSNDNWRLGVEPTGTAVSIGQSIRIRYQLSQPGYVQVLYVGSDRKDIKRLWPSEGQVRFVSAAEGQLPFSLDIAGPPGDNTFLMVVSQTPLNLDDILRGGSATASPQTMQQLGCELIKKRNAVVREDDDAGNCRTRNAIVKEDVPGSPNAANGYTARVFSVRGL